LPGTVIPGIVSALDRDVLVPGDCDSTALPVPTIRTGAAINPGNGGGAMVNCAGQLIGIPWPGATVLSPSGRVRQRQHRAGLALPADLAKMILTGTMTRAHTSRPQTRPVPPVAAYRVKAITTPSAPAKPQVSRDAAGCSVQDLKTQP